MMYRYSYITAKIYNSTVTPALLYLPGREGQGDHSGRAGRVRCRRQAYGGGAGARGDGAFPTVMLARGISEVFVGSVQGVSRSFGWCLGYFTMRREFRMRFRAFQRDRDAVRSVSEMCVAACTLRTAQVNTKIGGSKVTIYGDQRVARYFRPPATHSTLQ